MANNPAVLFYTSDFLTGTSFLSNKEVGAYIRILSYQHQLGHLDKSKMLAIMFDLNDEEKNNIFAKFLLDKKSKYFNKRMEKEIIARKKYSESRSRNRAGKRKDMNNICNSYEKHMENENENENENINISNNLFIYLESLFSRTFNSIESELINQWEDNELTRYAIKQAVLNNKYNLKYIDAILYSYKKQNITTIQQAEEENKKFKESKKSIYQKNEEEMEAFMNEYERL